MKEIFFGIISGIVAALGMGGGTILILLLGLFTKLEQHLIQGINLVFFIPTSIMAIFMNIKNKNINYKLSILIIICGIIGAIIGAALDLDRRLNSFADKLEKRFSKESEKVSVAEGFVTSSLLFCVGALTVVGSLQAGLTGDNEMLFTKSTLDFISSIVFAASLGIGVMFSAGFVFVFQGLIVVCAGVLSPLLSDAIIAEMTSAGGLLIFALGLNLLGITKLKVMNYIPAIFMPIALLPLYNWVSSLL